MKFKLLFAFLFLGAFLIQINAQTLDQNASWPNISWTVTGTFNTDPLAFEADPSTSSNFAFDDDDAGSGSDDTIAAESPVIDLSAAFTAGETLLTISGDYIYRKVNVELLQFEYFDADASTWNLISPTVASTTTSTSNNFCSGTPLTYTSNELDISGFTSTQLAGFRYRIFYDDDPSGAGYKWGFCFSSPTITSAAPPSCIDPSMLTATAITPFAADLGWTENGTASLWNVEVVDVTAGETVTGIATASGIMNPYTVTGLTPDNDYEFYVQADCGVDGTSTWAGPFAFTTGIACPAPSSLTVNNITDTTADLGWTENGTATTWDLEIVTSGTTPTGTPTNTGVTINPYGATMLTANTAYQFYVRAECGGMNGVSTWSGPFNFTTECGAFTPDYLEDFSSYVPQCWTEAIDGDPVNGPASLGGSNWAVEEFAHLVSSGGGAVNVNIYQTGDVEWLLSPSIDLSAGGYEINLDVAFTNYNSTAQGDFDADDDVRLLYTEDGSTWVTIVQWNDANDNEPAAGGETFNFNLSAVTGSNVRFAFYSDEGATATGDKDFHIDNFQVRTIPDCQEPSALTVSNLTTSSADLEWTVSGSGETLWDIEYGATGFVQGAGTLVDDTANNPYSLSSLSSGVTYDYYVRAHCGAGNEGAWSGPFTFRVPNLGDICETPLSAVVNADCAAGGASTLSIDFSASQDILSQGCDTGTGNRGYYISFTAPASGNIEISHNGSNNEFRIIDNCASGTQIECGSLASGQVISGLTPSSNYIMTIWKDSFNSLTTDEFCFSEVTCLSPSNLTVSNLQSTSADLGWTPGGSGESSWEIEYGLDGFTQGTGTTVSPATNPQSITGLTSNTGYDYYVRANCGGGDFSEWSGPFNFTTSVGPHNFPLYEDFESGFSFFDNVVGNDTDFILTTTYFHTGSQSVQNAHGSSDLNYLHETGVLDLSTSTSPELRFWHIAKTEGTWDECYVQISTDGGMTYTNLPASAYSGNSLDYDTEGYFHEDSYAIWGTTDSTPDNATWWQEEVFSLDAYKVANVRIRFFLDSDSSANREGWFIDDIVVQEAATDYTWDGTAWNISPEGNITANDNMIVQSGMMPSLTSAISVNNLTIEPGASLEANNGNITVAGNLINNGSIISANQLIMNSATGSVSGTGSMTNFTVGATSVVAVSGSQSISGTLDVLSGGSLDAGGNVTMVSNAMGTARIDETDAGAIIGDVNVERYIPAGNRAYRFIGSTVSGPTVFDSWQEGGANDPGFGTHVSGTVGTAGTVNATTGHDETLSGAQSMFLWNAGTQAWAGVSNTRTEVLNAGTFYRMLVRGDRTTDLSNDASVPAATTLRATGTLQQTAYSVTPGIASGQFFTFANPYQSKLDMSTSATGTAVDMYYWDPTLGMFGDYVAINVATGSNTAGTATNVLEPGQAVFFRDNSGASVVSVSQSDKTPGTSNAAVFNTSNLQQTLRLKLYQTSRYNNNLTESDGLYIDFAAGHNLNLDGADAVKLNGANTNISIAKNTGEFYEVERRPLPSSNETVPLAISNYLSDNYTVVATLDALPGVTAYFKDNFTGNLTPITQNASTAINFTVDVSNAASMDSARFEIVFEVVVLNTGDISFSEGIKVYPNPVDGDELHISIGAAIEGDIQITLVNTLGQQVISKVYKGIATEVITLNNLSQLEKGLYIATISNGRNTVAKKLILN